MMVKVVGRFKLTEHLTKGERVLPAGGADGGQEVSSPKISSISERNRWTSLSSMEMKMTPASRIRSLISLRRGIIMHNHLSWRVRSSLSTTLPNQSFIIGDVTLSL